MCKKNACRTQLADVYGRIRISAKYHKTKTPKRHCERISRREREERHVDLSVLLARSDNVRTEQNYIRQEEHIIVFFLPFYMMM